MVLYCVIIALVLVIVFLLFLLSKNHKEQTQIKKDLKTCEKILNETNELLDKIEDAQDKITKKPDSVGFRNSVDLLHNFSKGGK